MRFFNRKKKGTITIFFMKYIHLLSIFEVGVYSTFGYGQGIFVNEKRATVIVAPT